MDASTARLNPPQQYRSRKTLERIVRASLDILDAEGPDGLTVQAIVDRAGSSVGSFYARFGGKADLLDYLGARVWDEALDRWNERLASRDWSELELSQIVEGAVMLLVDSQESRAAFLRTVDRATGGNDAAYLAFRAHVVAGIGALLLEHQTDIDHVDPELAVRLGLLAVVGMISAATRPGGQVVQRDTLVGEARDLLLRYLTSGEPEPPSGDVEFFDVWT